MKRIFLSLLLVLFMACSNVDKSNTIITAMPVDIDSLNPYKFVGSSTEEVMFNVYEGLVKQTPEGDISPCIAKSYNISEDGLTYTFDIRNDVYFHNGSLLTPSDVVFSLNKMKELKLQPAFKNIKDVKSDGNKVIVQLEKNDASLIYYLISPIVDEQTYSEIEKKANGTGPYEVKEYKREQKIDLKAFDKYWGDKPNVKKVNIKIVPNSDTIFLKYLSGELNFIYTVDSKRVNEIKDKNIIKYPRNMLYILGINNKKYDKKVREALSIAINRGQIQNTVLNGYGKLLDKDKTGDTSILKGMKFDLKVPVNSKMYTDSAQVIKQQLDKVGASVNIIQIEWASWLQEVYTNRDYELTLIGFTGKLDKDAVFRRYLSDYKKNFSNFSNEEYDRIVKEAKITINPEKRNELYNKAWEILLKEKASVFIVDPSNIVICDKNITGFVPYTISFIDFSKLKIEGK